MRVSTSAALLIVLLACTATVGRSQVDCFTNPTDSSCTNFNVDNSPIEKALNAACNTASNATSGWPTACTLWRACKVDKAKVEFCQPLDILLTGCTEQPLFTDICSKYTTLCSPQSQVSACKSQRKLVSVPSADSLFNFATAMCKQMTMNGCDQCTSTAAPGTVQAQALQVQCPDPLTSISIMCRDMFMTGCDTWDKFCVQNGNNEGFPTLCENNILPSSIPKVGSTTGSSNTNNAGPSSTTTGLLTGASATADESCITDPTKDECAAFRLSDARAAIDVEEMCDQMPNMIGCTLEKSCRTGTADGPFCAPFSILSNMCVDMPSMKGCQDWSAICSVPNTKVLQCKEQGPIPSVLRTEEAMDAIIEMCSTHSMEACQDCTVKWAKCADPMDTLSELCLQMPGMPQCSRFFAMCSEAQGTFTKLCGTSGSSSGMPPMKMYLHASMSEMILLKEWVPQNDGEYIASCLAVIFMAILVQALKGWRVRKEMIWAVQRRVKCCSPVCPDGKTTASGVVRDVGPSAFVPPQVQIDSGVGDAAACCGRVSPENGSDEDSSSGNIIMNAGGRSTLDVPTRKQGWFADKKSALKPESSLFARNSVRSLFTMIIVFFDYMLMLIVMTFNIGLIVSAVLGFGIGALLFGHMGEGVDGNVGVASGDIAPDSENDLEVHFVDPQTCCNSRHV